VHFMRNALAYVPKTQETVVAAALRQAFIQPDRETAGLGLAARRRSAAAPVRETRQVDGRGRA
jgi:transposase-like protein